MIYYDIFVCKKTCTFQKFREVKISEDLCAYIENTTRAMTIFSLGEPLQSPRIWEICFRPRYFRRNTLTILKKILAETSLTKYKKAPLYEYHENEWLWFVVNFEGGNMKRWKKLPISDTIRGLSLAWITSTFLGVELGYNNIHTYLGIELGEVGRFALHCQDQLAPLYIKRVPGQPLTLSASWLFC